jgi:hypothetical protein
LNLTLKHFTETEIGTIQDYLTDLLLTWVNDGFDRTFTLQFVDVASILRAEKLTEEVLNKSLYLQESSTGTRLSKLQKKLLLRSVDLVELMLQRDKLLYMIKHHPETVKIARTLLLSGKLHVVNEEPEVDFENAEIVLNRWNRLKSTLKTSLTFLGLPCIAFSLLIFLSFFYT